MLPTGHQINKNRHKYKIKDDINVTNENKQIQQNFKKKVLDLVNKD